MAIQKKRNGEIEVTQEIPIRSDKIKFKISASRESWLALYKLSIGSPKHLRDLVYLNFTEPVSPFLDLGPRFRGINRGREDFVLRMKALIPSIYYWVFWWLKEPFENWPTDLGRLVEEIKAQPWNISGRRRIPNAAEVTAYLFEKDFGKERRKNGLLKWTDNPEGFRRTFISNSEFAKFFKIQPPKYFLKVSTLPHPKAI